MKRLSTLILALAVAGCGLDDGAQNPRASLPEADSPKDAGVEDSGPDASSDTGPPKRTVSLVNPVGVPAENLFADGDFEWSIAPRGDDGQYGFRAYAFDGSGTMPFTAETGGLCRTGLHCGVLEPKMILFGRGTAAGGGAGHAVTVFLKPPAASCKVAQVLMVNCDDLGSNAKTIAAPKEVDDRGWCRFEAKIPPRDSPLCLYVSSQLKTGQTALVDAATLLPDYGDPTPKGLDTSAVPPATIQALRTLEKTIRRTTPFLARRPPLLVSP